MKILPGTHTLCWLLSLQLLAGSPALAAQTPERRPLGALRASGQAFVNELRVSGDLTLFVGDTLRTGADGIAALTVPGRGALMISPTTELSFVPTERHFASLGQGTVGLRSLAGAINFQMQVGGFLVVPVVEAEAAAEIRRFPNGSAQVTCSAGSVAVVALEETESVFLQPGQTAGISAEGKLIAALPSGTTPSRRNPEARHSKKRTGLIVLGVAGGGAAGAIAGLASRRSPASPSGP